MLGWFFNWIQYTCIKEKSQHLVSFSSDLFLSWEGRSEEEGGEKSKTSSFFLQTTGSQFQSSFDLSHLLWWRGSKKSSFVSANGSFYKHGLMQNDTWWSKKHSHTLTETIWKVSLTRAEWCWQMERLPSILAAEEETEQSRGIVSLLGMAELKLLLEKYSALILEFKQCW